MTWPLPIFFRILFAALAAAMSVVSAASVTGQVTLLMRGDGAHSASDPATTVVWLSPFSPDTAAPHTLPHKRMLQKDKHFEPHILPVEAGTVVDFPNLDPIFHNAFSNFDGQLFDIGLYPPGSSRSIRFQREGLVRVFCNIHPTMSAVIVVLATPFFATTVQDGRYTLLNVAPGQYKLHFFQERATSETLDQLTQAITVTNSALDLGNTKIWAAAYIPTPHKNKYGRDYPPESSGVTYH
jgi:plastocyanin